MFVEKGKIYVDIFDDLFYLLCRPISTLQFYAEYKYIQ